MIAIFFSRPLTLTISCFAITSLLQELMKHRATPASRSARRRCAQINVGICGMAPGMVAHNSLSNTKLVVAAQSAEQGAVHLSSEPVFGLTGGQTHRSIATKRHKTQKVISRFCAFWWDRTSVATRR